MTKTLACGRFILPIERPLIMGIVNLTPDSFSGDGFATDAQRAVAHARRLIEEGADLLDLGAESSRPGAPATSLGEELDRLLPVVEALRDCGVPLSIDTYKPEVMRAALAAGADMINDIYGLRLPGAIEAVAGSRCGVCIMHMQGEPRTMQHQPAYDDVCAEVAEFLSGQVARLVAAGVGRDRLVLDPGFGFGKSLAHNIALFHALSDMTSGDLPVLVGVSRKSMLGLITGRAVGDRLPASVTAALLAAQAGARILRVHDVAATRDALMVLQQLSREKN